MISSLKHYISSSIKRRFTFGLTLFLIIPLVFIFIILNYLTRNYYFDQACKVNFEIHKQSKPALNSFITDNLLVSELILSDSATQSYLKVYGRGQLANEAKYKIELSYNLQSLMLSRDYISSIAIFDNDNILVQFGDYLLEYDDMFMEDVIDFKGKPVWTHAYQYEKPAFNDSKDKYVVSLIRAINDLYSFQILGYERISIDEAALCDIYSGINTDGSDMYIVNSARQVVSSTDKSKLGTIEPDIVSYEKDEGFYIDGEMVLSYYTIKENGWRVIKRDPKSNFYASYTETTLVLIVLLMLTIAFGIVFKRSQDKNIINPLKELAEDAAHFREGNYSFELRTLENDEIGQLNRTLITMCKNIESLIENDFKNKLCQKEIELKYLQSQINPHFLYNTLDSIRWMAVMHGELEISEQIEALSDVFRHTLNYGRPMTTVGEEVVNVENYMKIQRSRFGDRIKCNIVADEALFDLPVLHLLLLPLVENSLVHGLERKPGGGTIDINIFRDNNLLIYQVSDDGVGTNAKNLSEQLRSKTNVHNIFALNNIDERVKRTYGDIYGLEISSTIDVGTTVVVKMPINEEDYNEK